MEKQPAPMPKPRKYPELWQAYQLWSELMELRKRHLLRISAIERGVSNMDAEYERMMLDTIGADALVATAKRFMVEAGKAHPMWEWVTSIRGLGEGGLAAQLLAQIDDISSFATVSKLWRFAGYAVIDGQIDRCARGTKSPYSRRLKSTLFLIVEQFIRQQTSPYAELYYAEKERQRRLHPETICRECGCPWEACSQKKRHHKALNDGHIHHRAMRKTAKIFLQHLWVQWRTAEGLPVTMPYVHDILGHNHYIGPAVPAEAAPILAAEEA